MSKKVQRDFMKELFDDLDRLAPYHELWDRKQFDIARQLLDENEAPDDPSWPIAKVITDFYLKAELPEEHVKKISPNAKWRLVFIYETQAAILTIYADITHSDALRYFRNKIATSEVDLKNKSDVISLLLSLSLQYLYEHNRPERARNLLSTPRTLYFLKKLPATADGLPSLLFNLWGADLDRQSKLEKQVRFEHLGIIAAAQAHQFNQPIGIIRAAASGALADLREGLFKPEELQPLLEKILRQTDRMSGITGGFRDFSRGDRTSREIVAMNDVVQKGTDIFRDQFLHRNIKLDTQTRNDDLARAQANPFLLQETLINLISNARDAVDGRADAAVEVRVLLDGEVTGFIVEDNGPGLAPGEQDRAFLPFVSGKSTEQGSGIGLFICKKIVDELGGRIKIENRPTGGARFSVLLPLVPLAGDKPDGT